MSFLETVEQARGFLSRNGRVSLRALQREFDLDDATLEDLVLELVETQGVAVQEGRVLVWSEGPASARRGALPQLERSPRDYTPRHLAEKILRSQSALQGERKQVTVLFADVKGSMELAEQLGAEEWHQVLERFFRVLTDGVHRFEGSVNQYTGDGVMALFGAPIAHEDHAQRACYAALHLRDALREFSHEVKRRHGVDLGVRMGLNSGSVVVGKIGDDLRMDYTAQGHTVGLAQRLEAMASAGSIYAGEATAQLVTGYFDFEDLGEFQVKGAAERLRVFELQGMGKVRTRFDLSRARGLSRFVGRRDEMSLLETALEQGLAGPGRTLGVVAQAGTGKSRLSYEFVERCRSRGITVYEARGLAHGKHLPLAPMLELMRSFFGIAPRDSDRVVREKVAGRLILLDESLRDELPIFFDLLGVTDPERPLPTLDPEALQRRMHAAVRAIVRADAAVDPGVILVEDLHWLDDATDTLLSHIVEANAAARGLVLVNFRPEYQARWMQQSHYQQLSLLPLSEDALGELLRELLGGHESVAGLPSAIHARTGGNPFFIEEMIQALVDEGRLEGERGAYRLTTPIDTLPVPENVQSLLAARIDRLPERDKRVLQTAAVIGKTFRERVLARVVDIAPDELEQALRNLQDGEFLYEAALYPEREYTFKHPLTQEVADASQLTERRQRAHAGVARAIEAIEAGRLDEQAALLAHHWERADEPRVAARWHARAAGRIGVTDYADAFEHWRRVDALLADVEPGGDEEAVSLRVQAFQQLLLLGFRVALGLEEAERLYRQGRRFLEARQDDHGLARLLSAYAAIWQTAGRTPEYLALIREAEQIAERTGDATTQVQVGLDLVWALHLSGFLAEALEAADRTIERTGGDVQFGAEVGWSPLAACTAMSALPLMQMARYDEARERLERAAPLMAGASEESLTWTSMCRAELALLTGDPQAALQAARAGRDLAERSGSRFDAVVASFLMARVLGGLEDWSGAVEQMEAAIALARQSGTGIDSWLLSGHVLARAHGFLGHLEDARRHADEGVARCRSLGVRVYEALVRIERAGILGELGEAEPAEADLVRAEQLLEETGARAFVGRIEQVRARLAP